MIVPSIESPEYRVLMRDRMEPSNAFFFPYMSPEIDSYVRNHQAQLDEYHKQAMNNSFFNLSKFVGGARMAENNEGIADRLNRVRERRVDQLRLMLQPAVLIRGAIQLFFISLFIIHFLKIMDTIKALVFLLLYLFLRV